MTHLLSLAALHAAAPGVLDVVFGPDGDFEGVPYFAGPVVDVSRYGSGAYRYVAQIGERVIHFIDAVPPDEVAHYALDLRVPSVAARLAGLCARALGHVDRGAFFNLAHRNGCSRPVWTLHSDGRPVAWWSTAGLPHGRKDTPRLPQHLPADPTDRERLFTALTLALAPRIAALQSTP